MFSARLILIAVILASIAVLSTSCPQSGGDTEVPQATTPASSGGSTAASTPVDPAPEPAVNPAFAGADFSFKTFDGAEHKLSDYTGKPVVVNFFGVT